MSEPTNYLGIINHGNFCYLNSVLQSLALSPSIVNGLSEKTEHEKDLFYIDLIKSLKEKSELETNPEFKKNHLDLEKIKYLNIYLHFKQLMCKLLKRQETIIDPRGFIIECKKRQNELFCGIQNDAQEFLLFLLDHIHEAKATPTILETTFSNLEECGSSSEKKILYLSEKNMKEHFTKNNYSWVVKKVYFQMISIMKCNKCVNYSLKFEPYRELPLEIPEAQKTINIYDCLDNFFGKEMFEQGEEWKCDRCDNKDKNYKQYRIIDFPETLIIFFKRRVNLDMTGMRYKKITSKIDFPFILNLKKYKLINKEGEDSNYMLYSVINHIGSFDSGHYYTYSRNIKSKLDSNWYKFNDERVSLMSESDIVSSNAYILFYHKM